MKKLTGRTRFRAAEVVGLGLTPQHALVWQVQESEVVTLEGSVGRLVHDWRDGRVEDLCEINHIVYSTINVHVEMPVTEELPGEKRDARKLH